jgi:hypothetical protein
LIYLISQPPIANDGHADDGHASPYIDRNLRRKYAAQIAGNGVSGLQNSKISPDPLVKRGLGATVSFGAGSAPESDLFSLLSR